MHISDSVHSGWGLRVCLFNKLPADGVGDYILSDKTSLPFPRSCPGTEVPHLVGL